MQARRTIRSHVPALPLSALALLLSCGESAQPASRSTDSGAGQGEDTPDAGGETGDPTVKVGEFGIQLVAPVAASGDTAATPGFTSLLGKVYDGPALEAIVWEERAAEGDCKLLVPHVPFCDPSCGASVCVDEDVCRDNPTPQQVGTVTVRGLSDARGASEFAVEPIANGYVTPVMVDLPYPPCTEGAEITLAATGGSYAAFALSGRCILPLTLPDDADYTLESGKPLAITWKQMGAAGDSRIQVKLDISHHGGTKGKIECDLADSGRLEISAGLLDQLTALGVAGFPTFVVTRSSITSTTIAAGRVDLKVYTYAERAVAIPGIASCTDDDQCPEGQTCQSDLTCK